ncbi:MAG TPA: PfkB family carbohydrate kinase [Streptosporangiaceae bacterium]|nr:PfkB family carbohydrate kinase [Streptosporangiaceae bacterium]
MPARPVIIIGNLTIDDVIRPDGSSQMGTLGGNTVHAAAAALTWVDDVRLVARCGTDFPAAPLGRLREAGADTGGVRPIEGPTVRNWVIYEADGTRNWVYRTPRGRSAEVAPQPDDIPAGWLNGVSPVVHVAAMPLSAAAEIVRSVRAQAAGAVITLDTHEDWQAGGNVLDTARLVDVFVPSRAELTELIGYDDPQRAAADLLAAGVRCVVVKLGGDGALVARRGSPSVRVPAARVEVADPTGAGDSFCGGLAAGLALGEDIAVAAWRGCATAAAAIGAVGSLRLLHRGGQARDLLAGSLPTKAGSGHAPAVTSPRLSQRPSSGDGDYGIETMLREIATIPDVIASQLADPGGRVQSLAEWLAGQGIEHLYLTGCGDSAFAGLAASLAFRRHSRLSPHPVHALDFARYGVRYLPPASALLAISYSGKVGRTIEAARQAAAFGAPVIALTGQADSQLAKASDHVLSLDVPTLGFSPGTSTYIGMLCTLIELARRTSANGSENPALHDACEQLPGQAAKTLDWCNDTVADIAVRLVSGRFVTFLGAGPNEATARFGAAKLFEASQQIAVATNLEEWAHEEYFITRPGDPVVVVAPTGAAQDRAWEILSELGFIQADATVVSDVEPPGLASHLRLAAGAPEELSPVLAALPLAQLGFHLARLAGKQSYNFASEQAKDEHYATIHRATLGDPA